VPNKYTWHAEQQCIKRCKNKQILKDCIMVLVRLDRHNNCIDGIPCSMCENIIKKYKIRKVINIKCC
jgi:tRNA(Arg) A34 adenosine deaminase TadA